MKIGVFGGSFNPIHIAHLIIAEFIREKYSLDKVIFVPVGKPSHRENNLLDSKHRYNMLKLAIEDNEKFEISDIEIKDINTSYTIETLRKLQKIYKEDDFFEIIGGDSADYIEEWKEWKEILKLSKILVFGRKGYKEKQYENMFYVDNPVIEISASKIREMLKKREGICKYYLDKKVYNYIIKNNLYNGGSDDSKKK